MQFFRTFGQTVNRSIQSLQSTANLLIRDQLLPGTPIRHALGHRQLYFLQFLQAIGNRFPETAHRAGHRGGFSQEIPAQFVHLAGRKSHAEKLGSGLGRLMRLIDNESRCSW